MKSLNLSLEVFPPKKEEDFENAYELLDELSKVNPDFISVTYGAGGSQSKKTVDIASYVQNQLHIKTYAHLTCVGHKKENIDAVVADLKDANIHNVLALRGDRPLSMSDEQFQNRDFIYASDLIQYLKQKSDFHIAGGCYPEKHFEAQSLEKDLDALALKVNAGAELLISQLFFDNDLFYNFLEKARAKGITVPIIAGIMPITTSKQLGTTVSLSGSSVPKKLADLIAKYDDCPADMRKAGIEYAIDQIEDLKKHQHMDIHLYSMNKKKTTFEIFKAVMP